MHLSNLVNSRSGAETSENFLVENIQSFLEICRRVKQSFMSSLPVGGERRFEAFVKATIDSFDEGFLHSTSLTSDSEEDTASEVPMEPSRSTPSVNQIESAEEEQDEEFDGGAIRKRKKDSRRSGIDLRISRTFSAMESSEVPFSRVAFGATKTDRMRLEAELEADNGRFTHLVDDDETVVTVATGLGGETRMAEAREAFEKSKWGSPKATSNDAPEESSIEESAPGCDTNHMNFSAYQRSLAEMGIAKRVRSAAQVMLAPCVTPNLSAVFSNNSPKHAAAEAQTANTPDHHHDIFKPHNVSKQEPYVVSPQDLCNKSKTTSRVFPHISISVARSRTEFCQCLAQILRTKSTGEQTIQMKCCLVRGLRTTQARGRFARLGIAQY
jgi:hypothetical protein